MKTPVRLNLYERGIVENLVTYFGYTASAARQLVVEYIEVIRKLGGYDTCFDHAERLVQFQGIHRKHGWNGFASSMLKLLKTEGFRTSKEPIMQTFIK